jgi:hypothetical protein
MKLKWEITILALKNSIGKFYKVTRKLAELSISETKTFRSKKSAKKQLEEWLE